MSTNSKKPWYWLRNSDGVHSASVTFAFVAFVVTTIAFFFSSIESVGFVKFREFDTAACSAYLVPILTLYFGRRWTEAKNPESKHVDETGENKHEHPETENS